jgi:hypothetical protein
MVHDHPSPCPRNGQPACALPLSIMDQPHRQASLAAARNVSGGERPIAVHHGREGDTGHFTTGDRVRACWCGPDIIPSA